MTNKKLIFIWSNLEIGGIECWLIEQLKLAKSLGYDIIWIVNGQGREFAGWREFIKNNIEKVYIWNFNNKILIESCDVLALSFAFSDYGYLLKQKSLTLCHDFRVLYLLPHFKDCLYYPEENLPKIFVNYAKNKIKKVYYEADCLNQLFFFGEKHAKELYNRYGIVISKINEKLVRGNVLNMEFNEEKAKRRASRNKFTIITCGRFDFPHKSYILGLISAYEILKKEYNDIRLIIIGYGDGQVQIENKISRMEEKYRKDVMLTGAVSPDLLVKYFDMAHINISVAGAVKAGAITGLVSVPARHYSEICEVYGFLPESRKYTLSDVPGEDVKKCIRYVMNISEGEYIDLCRKSFFTYYEKNKFADNNWLFNIKQKSDPLKEREISRICLLFFIYHEIINFPGRLLRFFKRLVLSRNKL